MREHVGVTAWLVEQIKEVLGDEGVQLVETSKSQGDRRYQWLCTQLIDFGYKDIVDDYKAKKKEHAAIARLEERHKIIRMLEAQLNDPATPPSRLEHLRKRIAQAQKYIDEREGIMPEETVSEKEFQLLAHALGELMGELMAHDFTGDIYLDHDENLIRIHETDVFSHAIAIGDFTLDSIAEIATAYQAARAMQTPMPLPKRLFSPDVSQIARQLKGKNVLRWEQLPVDLSTQRTYLTESNADDYENAAYKVWYVERRTDEHRDPSEYIVTECFYLALPRKKVHIIR